MPWSAEVPPIGEPANTIHLLIQAAKISVRKVGRCNNGAIDEHVVFSTSATGKHLPSKVGFASDNDSLGLLSPVSRGSIHIARTGYPVGIFVGIDSEPMISSFRQVYTGNHLELEDLDAPNAHTEFLQRNGGNAMGVELRLFSISNVAFAAEDDEPLQASHITSSWYVAHGVAAIASRHFANMSIKRENIVEVYPNSPITYMTLPPLQDALYPRGFPSGDGEGERLIYLGYTLGTGSYMRITSQLGDPDGFPRMAGSVGIV